MCDKVDMVSRGRIESKLQRDKPTITKEQADAWKRSGDEPRVQFGTGAVRGTAEPVRYDLISPIMMRRLAETCHEGAEKYGVGNALKGIPPGNLLNHALAHLEKFKTGYDEGEVAEDDLAHAIWNLMMIMQFEETRPDLFEGDTEMMYHKKRGVKSHAERTAVEEIPGAE